MSTRVNSVPINQPNENENRATSPVDSTILEDFHRQPEAALHQVYNNNNRTRRFRIQPTNQRKLFNYVKNISEGIFHFRIG